MNKKILEEKIKELKKPEPDGGFTGLTVFGGMCAGVYAISLINDTSLCTPLQCLLGGAAFMGCFFGSFAFGGIVSYKINELVYKRKIKNLEKKLD